MMRAGAAAVGGPMHRSAEEVEAVLRERGLSVTPQRQAIARCLSEHGGHWTAAELLARVAGEFPLASRATRPSP